jgi:hypothetical protein
MDDSCCGQVVELEQKVQPSPRHALGVAAPGQPFAPYPQHLPPIPCQGVMVARKAIMPKVAFEFPTQSFHLHPQWLVQVLPTPLADGLETAAKPLARGLSSNHPSPVPRLAPVMGKTQKVEGARRCALAPGVARPVRWLSKRHQAGLLRVQLQSLLLESPEEHRIDPLRVFLVLEAEDNRSVGKSDEPVSALQGLEIND